MKYKDIIIEVKTKWMKDGNNFYRDIIDYIIDCKEDTPKEMAIKCLKEAKMSREITKKPKDNQLSINIIDNNRNKITNYNKDLEYIINYTKHQWEV